MSDDKAREIYDARGLGQRMALGSRPAILVVDLTKGFTDPSYTLGSDLTEVVEANKKLLAVARERGIPVIFTTIGFEPNGKDGGLWVEKWPQLLELQADGPSAEIDPRLEPRDDETILMKKAASAFFGTNLSSILAHQQVDTVVLTGAVTSGCIRATAVDLMQHGYRGLVPRECVGDRAQAPHDNNLFDINAKYSDVVPLDEVIEYLETIEARAPAGA